MRILLLLFLLSQVTFAFAQSEITNQRLFDTIPYIPGHHAKRLALFAKEPMTTGQITFLGNSITEGGPWNELVGQAVLNRGIGGDIAHGVIKRLDEIMLRKPSKLFLMIGINDIGKDIPPAVIASKVQEILSAFLAKSPATRLYMQSILPVNPEYPGFPQHYNKQDQVLLTNQLLHGVAMRLNITFINLFPVFLDDKQRLDENLTYDGLHLNRNGYELWVSELRRGGFLE